MTGDDGRADAYARAARLIYVATCRDGATAALSRAHRLAAKAVRRAGRRAGRRSVADEAAVLDEAVRLVLAEKSGRRWVSAVGSGVRPPDLTEDQRGSLERLASETAVQRLRLLREVLDGSGSDSSGSGSDASGSGSGGSSDSAASAEQPRAGQQPASAEAALDDAPPTGHTWSARQLADAETLLTAPELDPMIVPVDVRRVAGRRRRRQRGAGAALTALVVAAGAGVWWFGIRTPALGSYDDDPVIQVVAKNDDGLHAWPARGELLGDTDLLRRAAAAWRRTARGQPLPAGHGPTVVFAGQVHSLRVVVMSSRGTPMANYSSNAYIAVYLEGIEDHYDLTTERNENSRVLVNPIDPDLPAPGGIRLLEATRFNVDVVLLPPGAAHVRTGPLSSPATGWQPARPDARGVLDVPMPRDAPVSVNRRPSGGIAYDGVAKYVVSESDSATLQETFGSASPVLPRIEADGHPVTAREWCAIRKLAEQDGFATMPEAERVKVSEVAAGPLPDGGGTGSVVRMTARGIFGMDYSEEGVLGGYSDQESPDRSCADASIFRAGLEDFPASAMNLRSSNTPNQTSPLAAANWYSASRGGYLVVAAPDGTAKLKVTGVLRGEADGRWLVIPQGPQTRGVVRIEAFAADGSLLAAKEVAR